MQVFLIVAGRVLGVVIALLPSIFALDVFSSGTPLWQTLAGFLIHSIPSLLLLAVLAVSFRWPLVAGGIYLVLALAPLLLLSNALWVNALLAAPLGLAGLLLVAGALMGRKI